MSESGWMIEATQKEIELLIAHRFLEGSDPIWWTGINENIMSEGFASWSHDPNDGVRFCRKEDAERVIIGLGYSLDNLWMKATEHIWSDGV
jgi:hypothetical protein